MNIFQFFIYVEVQVLAVPTQCENITLERGLRRALDWFPSCPSARALPWDTILFRLCWRMPFIVFLSFWFHFLQVEHCQIDGGSSPLIMTHVLPMTTISLLRFYEWLNCFWAMSLWTSQLLSSIGWTIGIREGDPSIFLLFFFDLDWSLNLPL